MPLTYNGITIPTNIDAISYNGNDVDIVKYNGATVWEKIKAYIYFYKNATAATGSMASQAAGGTITLNANSFSRANCNFLGWSTSTTATSATYKDKASITATSSVNLYAVWEMNTSKLTQSVSSVTSSNSTYLTIKDYSGNTNYWLLVSKSYSGSTYFYARTSYFDICTAASIEITIQLRGSGAGCIAILEDESGTVIAQTTDLYSLIYARLQQGIDLSEPYTIALNIPTKFRNKKARIVFRWSSSNSTQQFGFTLSKSSTYTLYK